MKGIITDSMRGARGKVAALEAFAFEEPVSANTMKLSHYTGRDCTKCGGGTYMMAGPLAAEALREFGWSVLRGFRPACLKCDAQTYCKLDPAILLGYFFEWAR